MLAGGFQIDLIGADAKTADPAQIRCRFKNPPGDPRARANAQIMNTLQTLDQLVFGQRFFMCIKSAEACVVQNFEGVGMDILQQQKTDFAVGTGEPMFTGGMGKG